MSTRGRPDPEFKVSAPHQAGLLKNIANGEMTRFQSRTPMHGRCSRLSSSAEAVPGLGQLPAWMMRRLERVRDVADPADGLNAAVSQGDSHRQPATDALALLEIQARAPFLSSLFSAGTVYTARVL